MSRAPGTDDFPIRYRQGLRVRIGPTGLGVALMFPFNFRSPAFFVAWPDVDGMSEGPWLTTKTVRLRGHPQVPSFEDALG